MGHYLPKYSGEFDNDWDYQPNIRIERYSGEFDNDWEDTTRIYVDDDDNVECE